MPISIFDRRAMARALEQEPARSFIRDTFFSTRETAGAALLDVDIELGGRRMASFVSPRGEAPVADREGYSTNTYEPPTIGDKMVTTAEDLQRRSPGESIYEQASPEDRSARRLRLDLAKLDAMITRREEWMCVRALFDAEIPVIGEGVDDTITLARPAGNVIALPAEAERWTADTAPILVQLLTWRQVCSKASGWAPNVAVLGFDAAAALLANENVRELLVILPGPAERAAAPGVTYLGHLKGTGLDLYFCDEWYVDPDDGTQKAMIPSKRILLGSTQAYTAMRYAPIPVASGTDKASSLVLVEGHRIPDSWAQKDPPAHWIKLSARPLPVPVQFGAFLVATVVA